MLNDAKTIPEGANIGRETESNYKVWSAQRFDTASMFSLATSRTQYTAFSEWNRLSRFPVSVHRDTQF